MKYFYMNGLYYYTTGLIPAKGVEFSRTEWNEAKADYKEAYGSLEDFSTEYKG